VASFSRHVESDRRYQNTTFEPEVCELFGRSLLLLLAGVSGFC